MSTLGEQLVAQGLISKDQLRIASIETKATQSQLGQILVKMGFISEAMLRDTLSHNLKQGSIDLSAIIPDPLALEKIPYNIAIRYKIFPISWKPNANELVIAMHDVSNLVTLDQLNTILENHAIITPLLAGETEIAKAIDQFYSYSLNFDDILHELETTGATLPVDSLNKNQYAHPIVRLVDAILADAIKSGASDIHFEPEANFLRLRYRIDGVLRQIRSLHIKYWAALAVRLKVLAQLDIAETRAPQDGHIHFLLYGRHIDLRVAIMPTIHGENIVLRILDSQASNFELNQLGLDSNNLHTLQNILAQPEGIVLVSGPTGSGKTTTLYAILNSLNDEKVNIVTLEDPVELPITGLRQSAVNKATKLTFSDGMRAILRQDPDIILVGEIRDYDTAAMALRAAMTGHQVYATLHANSALGAIPRLFDMGLQPDILSGAIIGVIAQRLIRCLCQNCRQPYPVDSETANIIGLSLTDVIYRSKGCSDCQFQGYQGRKPIMEIIAIDGDFDEAIAKRNSLRQLQKLAQQNGYQTLADAAIRLIKQGITSIEEAKRIVNLKRS